MLKRVLEAELMDTTQDAHEYDTMDHQAVNRTLVDDLLAAGKISGEILDLGTGTAQVAVELCRRADKVIVRAVDLAESMLEIARANVVMANLAERIFLDLADAKALPYAEGRFAGVMSNSLVHHIAEPRRVVQEAVRVVRSGGWLFFRDLLRPVDEGALRRLVEIHAAAATAHQKCLFSASLRAALTLQEVRALILAIGFSPDTVVQSSDRHWTWAAHKT